MFVVAVVLRRAAETAHRRRTLVAFSLRFPRQTEVERVEALLAG
jgi:hypothetical protein